MLIGIDASRASKKNKTGTEWYSHYLLRAMTALRSEHTVRLYTSGPLQFSLPHNWHTRRIAWPFDFFWTQGGLSLEMLVSAPDVLFVPSHAIPLIHPKKTVTTIHDVGFVEWREYRSKKDLGYLKWSTRYACEHAERVIAISEFTKKELVRLFSVDPAKVTVVHNGVDFEIYQSGNKEVGRDQEVIKSYGVSGPYILSVGRIDSRKNTLLLAKSFQRLKRERKFDGSLVLIGAPGYDGASIIEQIKRLEYADDIHCLGWLNENDKAAFLRSAACFVFPSLYEGFGIPVIEAQCARTPVVCSSTTSLPEIAGDGAVYVDPQSEESIVSGMNDVLTNADLQAHLIDRGSLNAQRFSWDACARETLNLLS